MVQYETVPYKTGDTWIDGRNVWAVVVPFSQGPQNGSILLPHGILVNNTSTDFTLVDAPRVVLNTAPQPVGTGLYNHRGAPYTVRDPLNVAGQIEVSVGRQNVQLQSGSDWSGWSGFVHLLFVY